MVSIKFYTNREQKAMRRYGGYIKVNDGMLKIFLRCSGADYREKSLGLFHKLKKFLKKEGYIFE